MRGCVDDASMTREVLMLSMVLIGLIASEAGIRSGQCVQKRPRAL
jgi:hypothetical protein